MVGDRVSNSCYRRFGAMLQREKSEAADATSLAWTSDLRLTSAGADAVGARLDHQARIEDLLELLGAEIRFA